MLEIPDESDEKEIKVAEEVIVTNVIEDESDHNENLIQVDKQCLCAITDHKCHKCKKRTCVFCTPNPVDRWWTYAM